MMATAVHSYTKRVNAQTHVGYRASAILVSRVAPTFDICSELIELNAEQGAEWKIQTLTNTLA